jgi:hypothetical protein
MTNGNWIGDMMHNLTAELLIEYTLLWELVDASHYNQHDQEEDFIIWSLTRDGEYSAKSAYSVQFEGSMKSTFPSRVWKVWAPSRCKFFLWLLLQSRVWTTTDCSWGNGQMSNLETAHHMLVECPISWQIWLEVCNWSAWPSFHLNSWPQNATIKDWYNGLSGPSLSLSSAKVKGVCSLTILVCWTVWHERNRRVFEGQDRTTQSLIAEIKDEAKLWISAGAKSLAALVVPRISE